GLGAYSLVVPASMVVFAGLVLLGSNSNLVAQHLPLSWLYLWTLVFPIGLGVGLHAWVSLEPAAESSLPGGTSIAAATCVRFGLIILFVLLVWAELVLNVTLATGQERVWRSGVVLVMAVALIALMVWSDRRGLAGDLATRYGRFLQAMQRAQRRQTAGPFYERAAERWEVYANLWRVRRGRNQRSAVIAQLESRPLALPPRSDRRLRAALKKVTDAETATRRAARGIPILCDH